MPACRAVLGALARQVETGAAYIRPVLDAGGRVPAEPLTFAFRTRSRSTNLCDHVNWMNGEFSCGSVSARCAVRRLARS
jgi:hypothetical protein